MRTPWDALYTFYPEHRLCSGLDGGFDGVRVWMSCECGAGLVRAVAQAPISES